MTGAVIMVLCLRDGVKTRDRGSDLRLRGEFFSLCVVRRLGGGGSVWILTFRSIGRREKWERG